MYMYNCMFMSKSTIPLLIRFLLFPNLDFSITIHNFNVHFNSNIFSLRVPVFHKIILALCFVQHDTHVHVFCFVPVWIVKLSVEIIGEASTRIPLFSILSQLCLIILNKLLVTVNQLQTFISGLSLKL